MQVIFETVPVVFTAHLPNGTTADGAVRFQVQTYAQGEAGSELVAGHIPHTAGHWVGQANSRGRIVIPPPARLPTAPPVEIPVSLLQQVSVDALVVMEWQWERVQK